MKRRVDTALTNLDGTPLLEKAITVEETINLLMNVRSWLTDELKQKIDEALTNAGAGPLTLRKVVVSTLVGAYPDDAKLTDTQRFERIELARRFHNAEEFVNLTSEDIASIKKLVAQRYGGVLIPVLASELLEKEEASDPTSS